MNLDNNMAKQEPLPHQSNELLYLNEFRTKQCPLFVQHKCNQHRPFTCFHWHFANQRRRRPAQKSDGTFNYNPDVYCQKYNESTGYCSDGDECPFVHRTAGDTERRYHLRYYKTATCVHETDCNGHCVKNGPHCAFAHGVADLRQPVYDANEMRQRERGDEKVKAEPEREKQDDKEIIIDDIRWRDSNYVLAHYKTELCRKPPRQCRQGYACPMYHNNKDKRRTPMKFKYRSTPCPQVKRGDEWGDPSHCDSGDMCLYCHTRTEQQFHPEVYKSSKCNDMFNNLHCPRGPFCAFAHNEDEIGADRSLAKLENTLAHYLGMTPVSEDGRMQLLEAEKGTRAIGIKRRFQSESSVIPASLPNRPIGSERQSGSLKEHGPAWPTLISRSISSGGSGAFQPLIPPQRFGLDTDMDSFFAPLDRRQDDSGITTTPSLSSSLPVQGQLGMSTGCGKSWYRSPPESPIVTAIKDSHYSQMMQQPPVTELNSLSMGGPGSMMRPARTRSVSTSAFNNYGQSVAPMTNDWSTMSAMFDRPGIDMVASNKLQKQLQSMQEQQQRAQLRAEQLEYELKQAKMQLAATGVGGNESLEYPALSLGRLMDIRESLNTNLTYVNSLLNNVTCQNCFSAKPTGRSSCGHVSVCQTCLDNRPCPVCPAATSTSPHSK